MQDTDPTQDEFPVDDVLTDDQIVHRFQCTNPVEVTIQGDSSRTRIACRVIENIAELEARAVRLLDAFMRDRGEYELSSIDVLPCKAKGGTDFSLRFIFSADRDPNEYGYTYFEVYFGCHEPPSEPFWPHKLVVGFW